MSTFLFVAVVANYSILFPLVFSDLIKAVQSTQIHKPAVREVLDSMHMYMSRVDFWGASHTDKDGNPTGFADIEADPATDMVSRESSSQLAHTSNCLFLYSLAHGLFNKYITT